MSFALASKLRQGGKFKLTFPAAFGCASRSNRSSATLTLPYLAATWRGVNPF